jgi:hypothetical protein
VIVDLENISRDAKIFRDNCFLSTVNTTSDFISQVEAFVNEWTIGAAILNLKQGRIT